MAEKIELDHDEVIFLLVSIDTFMRAMNKNLEIINTTLTLILKKLEVVDIEGGDNIEVQVGRS